MDTTQEEATKVEEEVGEEEVEVVGRIIITTPTAVV